MQVIWVTIVTLTLAVIFRYIFKFYTQLRANRRFCITALISNAAAYSKGEDNGHQTYTMIHAIQRKVKVLLIMAWIYLICWYPLFILTLADYSYSKPRYYYRILTVVAWSHSVLIPLVALTMDHSFRLISHVRDAAAKRKRTSQSRQLLALSRDTSNVTSIQGSQHTNLYTKAKPEQAVSSDAEIHPAPISSFISDKGDEAPGEGSDLLWDYTLEDTPC